MRDRVSKLEKKGNEVRKEIAAQIARALRAF